MTTTCTDPKLPAVPTDTDEILDLLAAKVLTSAPAHGVETTLRVGVDLTDRIVNFGEWDARMTEVHGFVLGGLAVEVLGGLANEVPGDFLQPRDLVEDLAARLLLRGVKWDVDGREFAFRSDIPVGTSYEATLEAPITRATSGYIKDIERGPNGHWFWTVTGEYRDCFFRTDSDGTGVYETYEDDETPEQRFECYAFDVGSCSPEERRRRILALHH